MAQTHFGDTEPISAEEAMERLGETLVLMNQYTDGLVPDLAEYTATHEDVQKWYDYYVLGNR